MTESYESMLRAAGVEDDDPDMDAARSVDRFFRAAAREEEEQ